ncbi:MAG: helix-turn-helix domain-containing protein [Synechococcaceae cyanobacterium]|nr:helix-turn-helix domain-containing protein [Synechococcaceae cyanobacterium]
MTQPTPGSPSDATDPASAAAACSELTRLGERLRQAREQQQLGIEELAERLRLGTDQLLALENADPARLPEPVFVIAQAKRVAASLDLDLQPEISALRGSPWMAREGRPHRPLLVTPTPARPLRPAQRPGQRRSSPGWARPLGLAAVLVALLAGLAIALGQGRLRLAGPAAAPRQSSPPPAARPPAGATATSPGRLVLVARGTSWVSVRREDGSRLFEGNLEGRREFPLGRGLRVLAGRPDLVSAALNGQSPSPLGPIDAVQWRRFGSPAASLSDPAAQRPDR